MGAIPSSSAAAGAGIDGTMSEVGAALGVAVLGAVMHARFVSMLPVAVASSPPPWRWPGPNRNGRPSPRRSRLDWRRGNSSVPLRCWPGGLIAAGLLQRSFRDRPAH
jgi:hypothetical protein